MLNVTFTMTFRMKLMMDLKMTLRMTFKTGDFKGYPRRILIGTSFNPKQAKYTIQAYKFKSLTLK